MTYLGVCGWPVAHSRSPAMHNAALPPLGLDGWRYLRAAAPAGAVRRDVRALPGGRLPRRQRDDPAQGGRARAGRARASPPRTAIGAANTLTFEPDGAIHADNTDAPGLLEALRDPDAAGDAPRSCSARAGAARAAVYALREAGAADVEVWNRTPRARRARSPRSSAAAPSAQPGAGARSSSTARRVGLDRRHDPFKALPLEADTFGCRKLRGGHGLRDGETRLLEAARTRGARVIDGLEILVAQGAASFERWTGKTAPRQAMREAVTKSPST